MKGTSDCIEQTGLLIDRDGLISTGTGDGISHSSDVVYGF